MNYLKTLWGLIMKNNFQKLLSKEYTIEDEYYRTVYHARLYGNVDWFYNAVIKYL